MSNREPEKDWDQMDKDEKKLENEEAESDADEPGEYESIAIIDKKPRVSKQKKKPVKRSARK